VVADRLEASLAEKASGLGMTIHALEVMPDHVHLFAESDPTRCVAEIVNRLKGYTSRALREAFPSLRSRLPTPWTRSDFAASVGHVSAATVERYIAEQRGK
jgi:putative transposase